MTTAFEDIERSAALAEAIARWSAAEGRPGHGARAVVAAAKDMADRNLVAAMTAAMTGRSRAHQDIHAVLLKPVSDHCNLRCSYCYEGAATARFERGRMSPALLKKIICDACAQAHGREIQFLWHGGEPLLAGRGAFEVGVREQQRARVRDGVLIRNSVQTNGLLLDSDWLSFFARHSFAVGLSLDGPPDLHDARRVDRFGRGTHAHVLRAIRSLRSAGIDFGVIAVIGDIHVGHAERIVRHFHEIGVQNLDLHPDVGRIDPTSAGTGATLSSEDYASFMTAAFDEWLRIGDPGFRITLFDDFINGWFGARPRTCYFNGTCGSIVAVEANGDVVPCTRPFERRQHTFGNLHVQSLADISRGERLDTFRLLDKTAIAKTRACRWHLVCSAGCPQHRRSPHATALGREDVAGINPYCTCVSGLTGGHADVWAHIVETITEVFDTYPRVGRTSRRPNLYAKTI